MFTQKVISGFQMHSSAALEIPAVRTNFRAFIGVYSPWPEKRVSNWRVHRFEIAEANMNEWFGEETISV